MNLPFFIAKRYLLSKRKQNFINIISVLSLVSVAFCTAALIIVLSVFNGLEDLLRSINHSFDPEIKIEATEGKSFVVDEPLLQSIKNVAGVEVITEVIEDYAYARYRDANQVVILKGVSDNFIDQNRIPPQNIVAGELLFKRGNVQYAVVGRGIQYALSIPIGDEQFPLQLYYINSPKAGALDPSRLYSNKSILPGGAFSIIQNYDENYVLVPLTFAQEVTRYGNKRTALELKIKDTHQALTVQKALKQVLGEKFQVLTLEEQHKDLYRLLKIEKLFTFLAFTLLLGISAINIFFSLMMLAIEKKKDISVLGAMGADRSLIKKIFLSEGALIAFGGSVAGLVLGGVFCLLQQQFGLVSMGMQNAVSEGYPVKIVATDFIYTVLVVSFITFATAYRPAVLASKTFSIKNL